LNDFWREAQVKAGIAEPTTIHGLRTRFTTSPGGKACPMRSCGAMAGRAGTEVAQWGQDKHLHYSRGCDHRGDAAGVDRGHERGPDQVRK